MFQLFRRKNQQHTAGMKLKDKLKYYDPIMRSINRIGTSLYQGYLPDKTLGDKFSHLHGFHDSVEYTAKGDKQKRRRKTLNVPQMLTSYLAGLIYTENVDVTVESKSSPDLGKKLDTFLHEVLKENDYWRNTREHTEMMFNSIGKIEKPVYQNGKIKIDFILPTQFYESGWDNRTITETQIVSEFSQDGYHFTKITTYEKDGEDYVLTRELYRSKHKGQLGNKINYNEYFKDSNVVRFKNWESIPFTFTKTNMKNNQSFRSPLGLPLWFNSIDVIADLDLIFDQKYREVRYGGRTKALPRWALKKHIDTDGTERVGHDPDDPTIFAYNGPPTEKGSAEIKDLTSPIRDDSFVNLINQGLDMVSVKSHLDAGLFRFDGKSIKTATEVITEKSETNKTKVQQEKTLAFGHQNLFRSILEMGAAYNMIPNIPDDLDIDIHFDDSIIIDDHKRREENQALANSGYMAKWRYWVEEGYTEDEAKKRVEEAREEAKKTTMQFGFDDQGDNPDDNPGEV